MDWIGNGPAAPILGAAIGLLLGWILARYPGSKKRDREHREWQRQAEHARAGSEAAAREVRRLKSSLAEAEAARGESSRKLQAESARLNRREHTIRKLSAELEGAKKRLGDLGELEQRLEAHRQKLGQFEQLRSELHRSNRQLEELESLKAELSRSRERVEQLETAQAMLTETETNLTAELAHASSAVGELQQQLADASMERNKLEAAIHEIRDRTQRHPLAGEIQAKVEQIDELNRKLEARQSTIAALRSQLEQARRESGACREDQR